MTVACATRTKAQALVTAAKEAALAELVHHWGDAYEIDYCDWGWWARRRDGLDGELSAHDPEEMRVRIRVNYSLKPVTRDL